MNGIRNQLAGALFTLFTRLCFDLADDACHIPACFFLDGSKELLLGVVRCHLRDEFQFLDLLFMQLVDLIPTSVNLGLTLIHRLLALFEPVDAAVEFRATLIEPVRLLIELDAALLDFSFGSLHDLDSILTGLTFDQAGLLTTVAQLMV